MRQYVGWKTRMNLACMQPRSYGLPVLGITIQCGSLPTCCINAVSLCFCASWRGSFSSYACMTQTDGTRGWR